MCIREECDGRPRVVGVSRKDRKGDRKDEHEEHEDVDKGLYINVFRWGAMMGMKRAQKKKEGEGEDDTVKDTARTRLSRVHHARREEQTRMQPCGD